MDSRALGEAKARNVPDPVPWCPEKCDIEHKQEKIGKSHKQSIPPTHKMTPSHRQTGGYTERQADTQTGRHTGRQAHRQTGRHAQTPAHKHRHTNTQ